MFTLIYMKDDNRENTVSRNNFRIITKKFF